MSNLKSSKSTVNIQQSYVIEHGPLATSLPKHLNNFDHVVLVFDDCTEMFKDQIVYSLDSTRLRVDIVVLRSAGEATKSLDTYLNLVRQLPSTGFLRRKSCLVAIGGGTVIDLVGFVADTYQRGVSYINVPTTLLAMVDASIGGKVGINLPEGKHLLGGFHSPIAVLIDLVTLRSLAHRHFNAAWGEIFKVALLSGNSDLWDILESDQFVFDSRDSQLLEPIVKTSIEIKLRHIEPDWSENDLDRVLNLGHEVAHTLEAYTMFDDNEMMHGEAVLIGIIVAAKLARQLDLLDQHKCDRICNLLLKFCSHINLNALPDTKTIAEYLSTVVQIRDGDLRVVVPSINIGEVTILHNIDVIVMAHITTDVLALLNTKKSIM